MFESIRKHSKIVMFLLFLLIMPSFVLVGINNNYFSERSAVVAKVDGHDITQADWDNAHRQESDRLRAQNPGIDAKLLDSPAVRYATLERLVRDRVLATAAQKEHLSASDAKLARSLQEIPAIAALRKPDGTLDGEAYRALVGAQGLTPEGFEASVRRDLSVNQVLGGAVTSSFAPAAQAAVSLDAYYERREVQLARFDPAAYVPRVTPTDDDLKAYYDAHTAQFQTPEQAAIEYAVLNLDAVKKGIVPNEADLRTYYNENLDRLGGKEERRASHILITAAKDAPAADREKARARAQELLAAVRKAPATFADVAKKNSQDPGSAANGGDLGFFARGAMVKPFEDAAFSLQKGAISDVVESDFGFHIILVTDIKVPKRPSFEEVRPKLEDELRQQQATARFAEVAENFSNGVYEQADSLKATADKLKLEIRTASGISRTPLPGATGPLASQRFLDALFSQDSIAQKRNTEAVEIGTNELVSGRITAYTPARTQPLDEVRDQVRKKVVADKAAALARADGEEKLKAWRADAAAAKLSPIQTVSRDQPQQQLPREVVDAVLRAAPASLPSFTGVDLKGNGYVIARVIRIVERPAPAEQAARQDRQQYQQWWAGAEGRAYYELLRKRYKGEIKVAKPAAALAG
ncbi:SurA N-terminal domain-containing protein [Xylophilus sp.]|uniref:SurA N-terminal domain-containing protein n=1 Tax=Xylophilus sp. TaxID=2653893 RepID=UPI0013BD14D5|nr:SurA N-terminal domain-containing protein [Xylophilus sp.]KAF1042302.1 MAG: Peptidyl-prolyl cis-trans isomerase D [Xylophilus sp.]